MNAITKALSNAERSYQAALANKATAEQVLASSPGMANGLFGSQDYARAQEQERHFTGWVFACIRVLASKIAGQPINVGVKRRVATQKAIQTVLEPLEQHPLISLLKNPNDFQVAWSLMFVTIASLELTGRSVWWLPNGDDEIFPIPTSWVQRIEGASRIEGITIRPENSAEHVFLPRDEIVYFSYPDPRGLKRAWSPLMAAAGAVDSDEAIVQSQVATFKNGVFPRHAIIVGKDPHPAGGGSFRPRLTSVQQRQIVQAIQKRYGDTMNSGSPIILDGMIEDIKRLSNSPHEMDWMNSAKMTKERITQIFGVNPIVLGQVENANRASSYVADRHLIDYAVNPRIELLSQCLTEYLGPKFGVSDVWIEKCRANDEQTKLQWMTLLSQHGVLRANELRQAAGLEAIEELDGMVVTPGQMGIERAFSNLVDSRLSGMGADSILDSISLTRDLDTHKSNGQHRISS